MVQQLFSTKRFNKNWTGERFIAFSWLSPKKQKFYFSLEDMQLYILNKQKVNHENFKILTKQDGRLPPSILRLPSLVKIQF